MDGTESARPETWVRIHLVFLPHGQRGPGVPTDTAAQPYEGWINGWVQQWAAVGEEVTIRILAGREGRGRLGGVGPGHFHLFGRLPPAAVASKAAIYGLRAIIVQEVFDSRGRGQPEILEKGRKCEALGAEVIQTTVGPELFYLLLQLLEETGFFNASLYTPFSVTGIETLGVEIAEQVRRITGRDPDVGAVTHAGGGNVTGTARGLGRAGRGGRQG